MVKIKRVWDYSYGERKLNFHCLVDEDGIPLFEPSMFLFKEAIKGRPENTTRSYANDLRTFFTMLDDSSGMASDYAAVTDKQMNGYLNGYLNQQRGFKPATIVRHIASINQFYDYCYEHGFISNKPLFSFSYTDDISTETMMRGITTRLHRTYMEKEEFNTAILGYLTTQDSFLKERDELALKLGYHAGFRTHELVSYDNLNAARLRELLPKQRRRTPQSVELNIKGKGKKDRTARLTVDVTESLYNFIWGKAKQINGSIICDKHGRPLKNEQYGSQLFIECKNHYMASKTLSESEYNRWNDRSYHLLRACYATNMVGVCVDEGLDPRVFVTQWVGHSDPKTTDIYIFYDAVLNNRMDIIKELSLKETFFAKTWRETFKRGHQHDG